MVISSSLIFGMFGIAFCCRLFVARTRIVGSYHNYVRARRARHLVALHAALAADRPTGSAALAALEAYLTEVRGEEKGCDA